MRLIDADKFIEYLGLDIGDPEAAVLVSREDFYNQPTVYGTMCIPESLESFMEEKPCL